MSLKGYEIIIVMDKEKPDIQVKTGHDPVSVFSGQFYIDVTDIRQAVFRYIIYRIRSRTGSGLLCPRYPLR